MRPQPAPPPADNLQRALFDEAAMHVSSEALTNPAPELVSNLRHPDATNELALNGRAVAYLLRRARRRSIGMVVTPEGLKVSAPRWVAVRDVEVALRDKSDWILAKLAEQRERAVRAVAARVQWQSGAVLPVLGKPVTLVLGRGSVRSTVFLNNAGSHELHLGLPVDAAGDRVARAVQKWLKLEALRVFDQRCRFYADRMGVSFTRLSLSSARTRWGSASSAGSIRLHWRLIHFGPETVDYVVVHELAHLREMNHSARFWAIVAAVLPNYDAARADLRTRILPVVE